MESIRYFKLSKSEQIACRAICAISTLYDLDIDFNLFPSNPVYTKKLAAIVIGAIASDLRDIALRSRPGMFDAGFGALSDYIKKISVLL